ncbi:tetratricopeptide repeat protein [Breznakiella homolactica]|uniref:Tetratricopeptide repeat protein n=1 Tax=Breznakiella homolactica TaxID=2798577 RepID=A0A7T7XKY0_9SPIR|nr:tetratricopeptide repeat protein [Breznakiella homolactica]QQO08172.1 tetratricopeptide repeat protein [Breznakiella homolactica]
MKFDPILTKAARLSKRGRYGEAIQILEPEVVRYHDSFRYYYILGVSCLYAGDYGGAFTYFKRARDIKMREPSVLLGLAILFLRRGETDRAVDLYLEVQEVDPKNRQARRALETIRRYGDPETLQSWLESGKLKKLFPPLPDAPLSWDQIAIPAAGILILGAIAISLVSVIGQKTGKRSERSGFSATALVREEQSEPVQIGGSYRYILTRKQVLDTYEKARTLFTEYRDEAAKVEINLLLESNASESIKNKARLLLSYTNTPGFDSLKDRFAYSSVAADPYLYRGCYVIWRGMATNLDSLENLTSFDLLVGYDTRSTLEGIVPVVFDFSVPVDLERPLEVLGQVVPAAAGDGLGPAVRLEAIALHQSGSLRNGR